MKDPVRGTAKVAYASATVSLATNRLRLVITADGVPPTTVEWKPPAFGPQRVDRWPEEGDTVPVTVDRANPQNFEIQWAEMPKVEDRLRQRVDQKTQAALDEERGRSRKPPNDPSQS
jgi:hypothetical protein